MDLGERLRRKQSTAGRVKKGRWTVEAGAFESQRRTEAPWKA